MPKYKEETLQVNLRCNITIEVITKIQANGKAASLIA